MLTVSKDTNSTDKPAMTKIKGEMSVRYGKLSIQSLIKNQTNGTASIIDRKTSFIYSFDSKIKIPLSVDPRALRMPISFVL